VAPDRATVGLPRIRGMPLSRPVDPHRIQAGRINRKMVWQSLRDSLRKVNPAEFPTVIVIADPSGTRG
jgi:hypothetical protein